MKNRIGGLLMETGVRYNKEQLHRKRYFQQLLEEQKDLMPDSLPSLLRLSRSTIETLTPMDRQLLQGLESDPILVDRVKRLMTIRASAPSSR